MVVFGIAAEITGDNTVDIAVDIVIDIATDTVVVSIVNDTSRTIVAFPATTLMGRFASLFERE